MVGYSFPISAAHDTGNTAWKKWKTKRKLTYNAQIGSEKNKLDKLKLKLKFMSVRHLIEVRALHRNAELLCHFLRGGGRVGGKGWEINDGGTCMHMCVRARMRGDIIQPVGVYRCRTIWV